MTTKSKYYEPNLSTKVKIPFLKDVEITLTAQVQHSFTGGAQPVYPSGLGCHFRWVCGLGMYPVFPSSMPYGSKDNTDIAAWLDKEYKLPDAEKKRIFGELVTTFGSIREEEENSFGPTPPGTPSGPTFVVMSDNINSYTPEFPKNSGLHAPNKIANGCKTADFAQYLVSEGVGIVMGSPVGRNHWHQNSENFSLVQAWFWIPPWHTKFTVPGSHFISGLQHQPNWDEWYADVRKADGMKGRTNEDIDKRMWKNGERNSHLKFLGKGNEAC